MLTVYDYLLPVPVGLLRISSVPQELENFGQPDRSAAKSTALPYFSLVVPTYNEGRNIEKIVKLLSSLLDQALPDNYELIVVDDDSPDRTWERACELMPHYPHLRVMRRQSERGLSTAVIRGWQAARGEVLGVMDGDLQHPPEVLLKMLKAIERADLTVASRHVDGGGVSTWSVTRRFLSRGAQVLGLVICPRVVGRVSDPMSGYFMVRRSAIAEKTLNPLGYKILLEVIGRGDINRVAEVGYVFQERTEGESKVTWKQYRDYFHHLLRLRVASGRLGKLSRRFDFPIGRFLRFGLVGFTGLIVDMSVLFLLYEELGFGLTRSAIVAAECGIINNFLWNDRWTFGDISSRQRRSQQVLKRFLKFNLVCLMGLILKILLLNLLFNGLHLNAYLANFLAIAAVTIWNFWINLKLNWRVTEVK